MRNRVELTRDAHLHVRVTVCVNATGGRNRWGGTEIAGIGQSRSLDSRRIQRQRWILAAIDGAVAGAIRQRHRKVENTGKIHRYHKQKAQKGQQDRQFRSGNATPPLAETTSPEHHGILPCKLLWCSLRRKDNTLPTSATGVRTG